MKCPLSWQKGAARSSNQKSKLSYREANMLIKNKRLAAFKHRNRGYNQQQDPFTN